MILYINYFNKLLIFLVIIFKFSNTLENFKLPLLFYGFHTRNNSILDSYYSVEITGTNKLLCRSLLNVLVHKAELYHKVGYDTEVLNCTELIRGKCLGSNSCSVNINDCNSLLNNKNVNLQSLNLQYSCEPSNYYLCILVINNEIREPMPIFNGKSFREGVFGDFLIIPNMNSNEPIYPLHSSLLSKLLQSCLISHNCTFVTSDAIHSDDYFMKEIELLSVAICEKPVYLKANSFQEVAKQANEPIYTCFSIGSAEGKIIYYHLY
ncbi:uncharacterized protein TA08345 [Theileria annulata]|uniref:Uncharacterized protein n=1 Tax=Theileria annulata TaxID=5874 RepID=Q4U9P4_THEAN|nr:uncharacterized protein TA08345 [Theileria annulata]CAI76459.1 hypothetical protein TA08345 [Theileria annulata]|eukprot:XP_953084.1 hypothetical protein TA08345 [Theileria annulata]